MEGKRVTITNEPLVNPKKLSRKAQDALLVAIKEKWCIQEIQPILYLRATERGGYRANNADIGHTERINNLLTDGGIQTVEDLCGLTVAQVMEKTDNLGKVGLKNIMWALSNFHRHKEGTELLHRAMKPNEPLPRREKMNILFLDDDKFRIRDFRSKVPYAKFVSEVDECIEAIKSEDYWGVVFLDHDLHGNVFVDPDLEGEETGRDVARWIAENKPKIDKIVVHSHNPTGAEIMANTLNDAGYNVVLYPFFYLKGKIQEFINDEQTT
jgi:hypothetical protein